jgi:hypothetical protein
MSNRSDRTDGVEHLSPYAPEWAHDAAEPIAEEQCDGPNRGGLEANLAGRQENSVRIEESTAWTRASDPAAREDLYVNQFRLPRSLAPGIEPEPWVAPRRRSSYGVFAIYGRLILASAIAAGVALYFAAKSPRSSLPGESAETSSFGPRFAGHSSAQQTARAPQLVVTTGVLQATGDELPLAVSIRGAGEGAQLVINELPDGSTLSNGRPLGTNGWQLTAAELADAVLRPPRGFAGPMSLALELRLVDNTVADRRFLQVEWAGTPSAGTAGALSPNPSPAMTPAARDGVETNAGVAAVGASNSPAASELDPGIIATLLERGEKLIAAGDIAGARVVLRHAAEARDGRAALALGATYDPIALRKLGVRGVSADIATARSWYEKAKEFGSPEGQARLELLASQHR